MTNVPGRGLWGLPLWVGVWAVLLGSVPAAAQTRLEVGSVAPGWEKLAGTDGQNHSMDDLRDYDFVVVCFTCNTCPYAVDYEDRLIELQRRFSSAEGTWSRRVALVAINSNDTPQDQLAAMKERGTAKGFLFPYLRDGDQVVAKAFRAVYTPEFFVLDAERKIRYQGALDDHTEADKVRVSHVLETLEALAAGRQPATTYEGARGCKIRFAKPKRSL